MQLPQLHRSHGEEQLLQKIKKEKIKCTGMVNASEGSSTSHSLAAGWSELTSQQTL